MTTIFRYALDPLGTNQDNLVIGEVQSLSNRAVRAVAPTYGPFYRKGLVVYDNATDQILTPDVQYTVNEMLQDASLHYGQGIYQVILIKDPKVSNKVRINYQVLGGLYQNSFSSLLDIYEAIINDNRSVDWQNVMDKDVTYPPTLHNHLVEDLYGFAPIVAALERIRNAIVLSDVPAFESMNSAMRAHITNFNNPHNTTAEQIGAYNKAQIDLMMANIQSNIGDILSQHVTDYTNPHRVTAAQTGAYTTGQIDDLLSGINTKLANLNFSELVNGNATAYLDPNGYLLCSGDIGAFSDRRLKKNIEPIRNAIEVLKQIGGWQYDWRSGYHVTQGKAGTHDFGVIANKLEEVLPEAVKVIHSTQDGKDFLAVCYPKLIPFLIAAAIDQDKTTARLKARVDRQATELRSLKRQMARLLKKAG